MSAVIRAATPALVAIKTLDSSNRPLTQGSGFLLSDGRVVTNAHVIQGASRAEIYDWEGTLLGSVAEADSFDAATDLAILPAMSTKPGSLELASNLPSVGDTVVVLGAPQGLTNTASDGIVSSIRSIGGVQMLQLTAPVSPGSSGGPVLDLSGRVVGVVVAQYSEGQNLNFAIPGTELRRLLSSESNSARFPEAIRITVGTLEDCLRKAQPIPMDGSPVVGRLEREDCALRDSDGLVRLHSLYVSPCGLGDELRVLASSTMEIVVHLTVMQLEGIPQSQTCTGSPGRPADCRLEVRVPHTACIVDLSSLQPEETGSYSFVAARVEDGWLRVGMIDGEAVSIASRWARGRSNELIGWSRVTHGAPRVGESNRGRYLFDTRLARIAVDCPGRRYWFLEFIETHEGRTVGQLPVLSPQPVEGAKAALIVQPVCAKGVLSLEPSSGARD